MAKLTCNKTKLIKLCHEHGYHPSKDAVYTKLYRARSWWLEWVEDGEYHKIIFSAAAGRAYLGCDKYWYNGYGEKEYTWQSNNVTMDQLNRLGLIDKEGK